MVEMNEQLATVTKDLDGDSTTSLMATFQPMFAQVDEWVRRAKEIKVTSEEQKREMKLARESRLALREIRINVEHTRKKLKEDYVRRGKAIDGAANILKSVIEPIEDYLHEQETFGERAAEQRKGALREARTTALRALNSDPTRFADLGAMDDETWATVKRDAELAEEARKEEARQAEAVRLEAERIAAAKREEERQARIKAEAERVERERQTAAENERLRAEAAQREEAAKVERARVEAEREAERRKAQADAEARELETRRAREEAERAETALAAERERAAYNERERVAAEERKRVEQEHAKAKAAAAPDQEKLLALAKQLRAIDVPRMATTRGQQIATGTVGRLIKLAEQIEEAANGMVQTSTPQAAE
jgi:hypothetical protein